MKVGCASGTWHLSVAVLCYATPGNPTLQVLLDGKRAPDLDEALEAVELEVCVDVLTPYIRR